MNTIAWAIAILVFVVAVLALYAIRQRSKRELTRLITDLPPPQRPVRRTAGMPGRSRSAEDYTFGSGRNLFNPDAKPLLPRSPPAKKTD
ncbi:MAG: hypothetical protein EHM78_02025 [Myxococcaceae bacterium]|nr:MAG: hypothetical protein EHM78_02025 [Myxococcaceae bacterium]